MNVELPNWGCNILTNENEFINYANNDKTRTIYNIYNGKAFIESTETRTIGTYEYSGTCLTTGDLVYKPELQVYFTAIAFCLVCFALILIYKVIFKRFLP